MGHHVNTDREYRLLQQRMDHHVSGVPETPAILQILQILYSPEEAEFARKVPTKPIALTNLARKLAVPPDELRDRMTDLARRGLMLDFEKAGESYYALPPVLGGIFEFVMMRARPMRARRSSRAPSRARKRFRRTITRKCSTGSASRNSSRPPPRSASPCAPAATRTHTSEPPATGRSARASRSTAAPKP